jgi:hypothetical protein
MHKRYPHTLRTPRLCSSVRLDVMPHIRMRLVKETVFTLRKLYSLECAICLTFAEGQMQLQPSVMFLARCRKGTLITYSHRIHRCKVPAE